MSNENKWSNAALAARGFVPDGRGGFHKPRRQEAVIPSGSGGQDAKLERGTGDAALDAGRPQIPLATRVFIRLTSVRRFLLDEDNLCEKYIVDCLRYSGLIHNDRPRETKIEVTQRKADPKEQERVIVEVFEL